MARVPDPLRRLNRDRILDALRELTTATRTDLRQATSLSRNTVASIVDELEREGLIHQTGSRTVGPGRPASLHSLVSPPGLVMVVDLGHDHVRVPIATVAGEIADEQLIELPNGIAQQQMFSVAAQLVAAMAETRVGTEQRIVAAVLGVPSPVDRSGRASAHRFRGIDLAAEVGVTALTTNVIMVNDADLGALGEGSFGSGRGINNFLYLEVSNGVGAGLILGGQLYRGEAGLAGNLGHVRAVPDGGEVCICGRRGCLETLVSIRSLLSALQSAYPCRTLVAKDLDELLRAGDPAACELVVDAGRTIGRTLAGVVNILNLAAIIVDGQLVDVGESLIDGIQESLAQHDQRSDKSVLAVVAATSAGRAQVLGGLALLLSRGSLLQSS